MSHSDRDNVVYPTGLDGYHFAAMQREFSEDEILQGLTGSFKERNPGMRTSEAMARAAYVFEYLEVQTRGQGHCAEVRKALHDDANKRQEPPVRKAA